MQDHQTRALVPHRAKPRAVHRGLCVLGRSAMTRSCSARLLRPHEFADAIDQHHAREAAVMKVTHEIRVVHRRPAKGACAQSGFVAESVYVVDQILNGWVQGHERREYRTIPIRQEEKSY